jgi:hypothetical protein
VDKITPRRIKKEERKTTNKSVCDVLCIFVSMYGCLVRALLCDFTLLYFAFVAPL